MSPIFRRVLVFLVAIFGLFAIIQNPVPVLSLEPQTTRVPSNIQINFQTLVSLKEINQQFDNKTTSDQTITITSILQSNDTSIPIISELVPNNSKASLENFALAKELTIENLMRIKNNNKEQTVYDPAKLLTSLNEEDLPTDQELEIFTKKGVLPPIKTTKESIQQARTKLKLADQFLSPHQDKLLKGLFGNALEEDRLKSLTPKQLEEEAKNKEELESIINIPEIDLKNIQSVQLDMKLLPEPVREQQVKIRELNYTTSSQNQNVELGGNLKSKIESTVVTQLPELSNQINPSIIEQTQNQRSDQTLNIIESTGYDSNEQPPNKQQAITEKLEKLENNWIQDIFDLFNKTPTTQALGLSNNLYSIIIYSQYDTQFGFEFDQPKENEQLYLRPITGQYSKQRFCMNNETNQIQLSQNRTCEKSNTNLCLDLDTSKPQNGSIIILKNCNSKSNQKWIFDEEGRLALKDHPDLCMNGFNGEVREGTLIHLWGCAPWGNQSFRAGYNNFGQSMGMRIWAAKSEFLSTNPNPGHAFVSMHNIWGLHNTYSRWPGGWNGNGEDSDCALSEEKVNNNCDQDAIYVDKSDDWYYATTGSNNLKSKYVELSKPQWDRIVFGSGYRDNWRNGTKVNLGSYGTYDWFGQSKSRDSNHKAIYRLDSLEVCSTYAFRLFKSEYWDQNLDAGFDDKLTPTEIYNLL